MKKALILSALALCATSAAAADTGKCAATPFSFGKPAAQPPKAEGAKVQAPTQVAQAEPKKVEPKPKPTLFKPCAGSKAKKPG